MAGKRIEKSWTWHLKAPRGALWPLVSDTERMNEALRLPRYRLRETIDGDGLRRRYGEYDDQGSLVRWEEPPFEWAEGHWWRWDRLYESGPLERARGTLVLEPEPKGGTTANYTLSMEPRSKTGSIFARTGHLRDAGRAFERLLKLVDAHARKPQGDFYANLAATRAPSSRRKSAAFQVPSEVASEDRVLARQLLDWLAVAFESDLREIRPKRIARALGVGPGEAHTASVIGTQMSALERRFRLICGSCRAVVREVEVPRDLPRSAGCPRCGVEAVTDYARSVEVVFTPHTAIREPSPMVFCASGPGVFPRIAFQQILDPHERRELPAQFPKAVHAVRTVDGLARLEFDAPGGKGALVRVGDDWIEIPETGESIVLENHGERVSTVIVEREDWPRESTSLAEWLTYQRCREATTPATLDLAEPQETGTLSLVVISARGRDEAGACRRIALAHDSAVVEDTGSGTLLVFRHPAKAVAAMDAALQTLPAARIGADHGPLWLVEGGGYAGEPRDRVSDLAGLAQEGVPNLSASFQNALKS